MWPDPRKRPETLANDKEKDDRDKQALRYSWLGRQVERRNPQNAVIRRWFKLADRAISDGDKDDKETPEK